MENKKIQSSLLKKYNSIIFKEYGIYSSYTVLSKILYSKEYQKNYALINAINNVFHILKNI